MAVPFRTGFTDDCSTYALSWYGNYSTNALDQILLSIKNCGGQVVRTNVIWPLVEPNFEGERDGQWWVGNGPDGAAWNYEYIAIRASALGLKILPTVIGCPTWVPAADRSRCRPECDPSLPFWQQHPEYYPGFPECHQMDALNLWYPRDNAWATYARFVNRVVQKFSAYNVLEGVEVWNEPNLKGHHVAYIGEPAMYAGMLSTTVNQVYATYGAAVKVCSAGLYMSWDETPDPNQGIGWKTYLDAFVHQCYPYAVGIHPYDIRPHTSQTETSNQAADAVSERVKALYLRAEDYLLAVHGISNQEIWVSETGAPSRDVLGENGQRRALNALVGNDAGSFFRSRPNCKMALLYRMYPLQEGNPPPLFPTLGAGEGPGTPFFKFSILNQDGTQKQAWGALSNAWH